MTAPLVEQLWGGALSAGLLRLDQWGPAARGTVAEGWREVERYYVVPTSSRPTMLLPAGPRTALLGSLNNYRGLRIGRRQLQRRLLSGAALAGSLPCPEVVLSVPGSEPAGTRVHPLGELAATLGRDDLRAAIGVRTGANRKATLQLVGASGEPAGFAKFSWSDQTATAVRREAAALETAGDPGMCRRPALLATGSWFGWPYLVSAPLPLSSRAVRGRVAAPTIRELHDLAPLTGRRPLATSQHARDLAERLQRLAGSGAAQELASQALGLLGDAMSDPRDLPMSARWHGDLTPWNTARDEEGHLWCWDWESTEADAVAGLDAVHWHLSIVQEARGTLDGDALAQAVDAAAPAMTGFGLTRDAVPLVRAVYVAALVERAVSLSETEGGWEEGWLTSANLFDLISRARHRVVGA